MPRTYSSVEKIRAELAWINETPDPNKCGCRNVRCCEETGHRPGECKGAVATKFWTFRWEYYSAPWSSSVSNASGRDRASILHTICSHRNGMTRCELAACLCRRHQRRDLY